LRKQACRERKITIENQELVLVYMANSYSDYLLAGSLLEEKNIPFLVKNEGVQSLFGLGVVGTGFNPVTGPIELHVQSGDAKRTVEILSSQED